VLGEYAVLGCLPALVASVAPRFSGYLCEPPAEGADYHLESPWAASCAGL